MDSVSIGLRDLAAARAASASHKPNPDSTCVCHKCEYARKDRAMFPAGYAYRAIMNAALEDASPDDLAAIAEDDAFEAHRDARWDV